VHIATAVWELAAVLPNYVRISIFRSSEDGSDARRRLGTVGVNAWKTRHHSHLSFVCMWVMIRYMY
jgi:hypothetical protein